MAERISFVPGAMPYSSMVAAEHVSRYLAAAQLCGGKRVLDIACGEGYGASLLQNAGAEYILGVDISSQAIAEAQARFCNAGIEFVTGDGLDLTSIQSRGPFDVIVCFETIEHVADPTKFLRELQKVLAPSGCIIISCPNDEIENEQGVVNPFHEHTFTYGEFRETTEAVLGVATQWLLGTPLTGSLIRQEDDATLLTSVDSMDLCLKVFPSEGDFGLPAQVEHRVPPRLASFFMGIWGAKLKPIQIHAPLSRSYYLASYFELKRLSNEASHLRQVFSELEGINAKLNEDLELNRSLVRSLEARISEIRRVAALDKDEAAANRHERHNHLLEEYERTREAYRDCEARFSASVDWYELKLSESQANLTEAQAAYHDCERRFSLAIADWDARLAGLKPLTKD
ncbi:MAG: class I SAM-dependent methyltransferase [Pseudomonadota bacterium]